MAHCVHGNPNHFAPDELVLEWPNCQGTGARHKCVICAYNEGKAAASGKVFYGPASECVHGATAPRDMISALPDYQGGKGRHRCIHLAYQAGLASGISAVALDRYTNEIRAIDATEAIAECKIRIGQNVFRDLLMTHWSARCPLTGITDGSLLRASHIKSWAICETDEERLDVNNGILLSSMWDAAFDAGLVSFRDDGHIMISSKLSQQALNSLNFEPSLRIEFSAQHFPYLDWHRKNRFQAD